MSTRRVIKVKDVMSQKFEVMHGMQTIREAINVMKKKHVGVVIVNKRHPDDSFGILLVSDIAKEVFARDRSPDRVNVYEVMTKPLLPVSPEMDTRYCARLFEQLGLSLAPVLKGEEFLGIIGYREIVLHDLNDLSEDVTVDLTEETKVDLTEETKVDLTEETKVDLTDEKI